MGRKDEGTEGRGRGRGRDNEENNNNHNCCKAHAFCGPTLPGMLLLQAICTHHGQAPLSFFLIAAVTNFHKSGDLTQHKFIIL